MLNNYLKLALKVLARRKFFTFVSLFGISLTLVVLIVATAVLDSFFAPRAPESRFDRALGVYLLGQYGKEGGHTGAPGFRFLDQYLRKMPGVETMTIISQPTSFAIYQDGHKVEAVVRRTDGAYWQILDHTFLEGSPFTAADDQNGNRVAVIARQMRSKLFGDGPAVGKTFDFEGSSFRVVGVVEDVPITRLAGFGQIWLPLSSIKAPGYRDAIVGAFIGVVLAKSRDDFPKLRRDFATMLKTVPTDDPKQFDTVRGGLDTLMEAASRFFFGNRLEDRRPMLMRSVIVLLAFLFITLPVMNLVGINLSRILERASEIGVRKAFGASSRTLVGQFVVENVVLTLLGGLLGFILAVLAITTLNYTGVIPYARFDVNLRVFAWGMLIAGVFGVLSGVVPAWKMSRMHPVEALRGGGSK